MNALLMGVWAELLKLRRSKITWIIFWVFLAMPMCMSLFRLELFKGRGDIFDIDSIVAYFSMVEQTLALHGLICFGFLCAWVFGREFSDRTVMDLLAMPFPRSTIVFSKGIALVAVILVLSACQFAAFCVMGILVPIEGGFSWEYAAGIFWRHICLTFMLVSVSTPIVFFASASRSSMLPLGVLIFVLILSNIVGNIGFAPYFPWSIPKVYIQDGALDFTSVCILVVSGLAGVAASVAWWRWADLGK